MRLYWAPRTRAARAVWMLEELGVPYERVRIRLDDPDSRSDPRFRAASPLGKVPALEDGEAKVADSAAICLYLADRFPEKGLMPPPGAPERGRYFQWLVFTPGSMEPAMAEKFGGWTPQPSQHGWGSFDLMIWQLEGGLMPGPWLLGERFSAADVMVGSGVVFMRMFGMLPANPVLEAYADRCLARPALQRAFAIDAEVAAEEDAGTG